ncbi:lysophospholipid acyltransferase family protein [Commensalibacter nepenthis]|uniref:Lysophospholipid acyltransferase family protein n=1 Tax=Commensalibacter nepenthis TaxID=3043872 RepID=A0ABT6Q7A5_9PROT|nr:lysophospholipid acyltransferase family protein [Commensalibacter sp. TBRC 10068]MDI2112760.1 lysophospholipid acyltransferase family protein [Commensalibacter sp. TBRC 10068]
MISDFFKKNFIQNCLVVILRAYLKFALQTTRWQFEVESEAQLLLTCQGDEPALVLFWHECLVLSPRLWWWALPQNPFLKLYVLISRNTEGRLITQIVKPWGILAVKGSSSKNGQDKGGTAAFRELLKYIKAGHLVVITPDGPRGPRHHCHEGALKLALYSKRKIVPVGAYCHSIRLNTWDKLMIPLPFGKGKIVCGKPMRVTRENYDTIATEITNALNDMTSKAQK